MAKKYLDDTGLTYLWSKLKAYFQPKLVSGTNIKTINNESLLGSGDISISGGGVTPADYVTEQDTSGIWTYRKWNSGIAECWGQTASTSKSVSTSYGNGFYAPMDTITFPSGLFTSIDSTHVTAFDAGAIGTWFEVSVLTTTEVKGYLWGIRSNTANFRYEIHAYGRWK